MCARGLTLQDTNCVVSALNGPFYQPQKGAEEAIHDAPSFLMVQGDGVEWAA